MGEKLNLGVSKDKLLFYFILIDVLLFPYLRSLNALTSMILLMLWYLFNIKRISKNRFFLRTLFFTILAGMSIFLDYVLQGSTYIKSGIQGMALCILYFLYYTFFYTQLKKYKYNVFTILKFYLIIAFGFALLFTFKPQMYFNIRSFWTMSGNVITYKNGYWNRFTFLQSDPNNCGCVIVGVMMLLLTSDKSLSAIKKIFYYLIGAFICTITISTTGFVVLVSSSMLFAALYFKSFNIKRKSLLYSFLLAGVLGIFAVIIMSKFNIEQSIFATAKLRIGNNLAGGTASGRLGYWQETIVNFIWPLYLFLGRGQGARGINGNRFWGYSGHFQIIIYYGFAAYIIFIYTFFRKPQNRSWRSYVALVPYLLVFSVNTLIIDFRASLVFVVAVAVYHSCSDACRCKNNKEKKCLID